MSFIHLQKKIGICSNPGRIRIRIKMNGSKTLVELKYNELNVRMPSFRCTHGERNGRGGSEC